MSAIIVGLFIKAAGEMAGYAVVSIDRAERQMHEYEMHKVNFAAQDTAA
jgi:hypothetical protein